MSQDIDKLKKLVGALDKVVEIGEEAMKDGKIDFADAMLLPAFAPILQEVLEVWKAKDELIEEAKDLDWSEIQELVGVVA